MWWCDQISFYNIMLSVKRLYIAVKNWEGCPLLPLPFLPPSLTLQSGLRLKVIVHLFILSKSHVRSRMALCRHIGRGGHQQSIAHSFSLSKRVSSVAKL